MREDEGSAFPVGNQDQVRDFTAANGTKIKNKGIRKIWGRSDEGLKISVNGNVANVMSMLLAVNEMVDSGNDVIFRSEGRGGSIIVDVDLTEDGFGRRRCGDVEGRPAGRQVRVEGEE